MAKAYAHKFARVTISGSMHNGAEQWSTGFQMGSPTVDMTGVNAPGAQNISTAWAAFFQNPVCKFSQYYNTKQIKVALINVDGTTDVDEVDYFDYSTPIEGGGGLTSVLPPQVSLAATLTSDNQRGLASKGRMYLPGVAQQIDGINGKLPAAYRDTLATQLKTFLDAVNTAAGVTGKLVLASAGHKQKTLDANGQPQYLAGRTAWVTGCRVGDVLDTQRRRRNGLTETYTSKVLAP